MLTSRERGQEHELSPSRLRPRRQQTITRSYAYLRYCQTKGETYMRRDEVESVRENLAEARDILASRGDPQARLERARPKLAWLSRQYMPTKAATKALMGVHEHLAVLRKAPPENATGLSGLRKAVIDLLEMI